MKLHLNGSIVELPDAEAPLTLSGLLALHKLKPETVVVEHNRVVPAKAHYDKLEIRDGDQIEIVKFMGGG
jgi:sulfur carrier protein